MLSYKELISTVQKYFAEESFTGEPINLYAPISYALSMGGKRIRPVMLLSAVQLFGGDIEKAKNAAIGIETFHNFTLLHDDLMDGSSLRRGKPTVYRKWNQNVAILSGDTMNTLAWHKMLCTPSKNLLQIMQVFCQTSIEVCEGQQYDMDFETCSDVKLEDYLKMIRLKTAVLLGCSLKIGALIADATHEDIEQIYQFGINLGMAFQLRDDLLDVYGDTDTFGKKIGTDIEDNKMTYLRIRAIEKADPKQEAILRAKFDIRENSVNDIINIYNQLDIRKETEAEIARFHDIAIKYLDKINQPSERKQPLIDMANQLLNRDK